jgi:hypothetical protein
MTHEDYEDQKRRLAEQHRSLMTMLESAHQTQLQALDMVWRMFSGQGSAAPSLAVAPAPAAAAPQPAAAAPPARRRRQAHELYGEVLMALYRVPEIFTVSDVCARLGYSSDRSSLYRALQDLKKLGHIAVQSPGAGTQPTHYRRLGEWKEGTKA